MSARSLVPLARLGLPGELRCRVYAELGRWDSVGSVAAEAASPSDVAGDFASALHACFEPHGGFGCCGFGRVPRAARRRGRVGAARAVNAAASASSCWVVSDDGSKPMVARAVVARAAALALPPPPGPRTGSSIGEGSEPARSRA